MTSICAVRATAPRVTRAVSVTVASSSPAAGRVTLPVALTTPASDDVHVTSEPCAPVVGSTRSAVTALVSPRSSAARSASAAAVEVSAASSPASAAVSARS